jgi:NADH-quinone oxidoreductase subunit N
MQLSLSPTDWLSILPVLILSGWGMLLLLVGLVVPKERSVALGWLSMVGLVGGLVAEAGLWGNRWTGFGGMVALDSLSAFIGGVGLLAALFTVWVSLHYIRDRGIERGEYYALLLFSTSGILLMAQAANLVVVFLGLELLSIRAAAAGLGRGGAQVLYAWRVCYGLFGLWHRVGVWCYGHN